jgi:hypothetical protein
MIADERTTAESLTRTQLEYVKNSDYINYSKELSDPEREPDVYGEITPPSEVGDYTLNVKAEPINPSDETDTDTAPYQPYPLKDSTPDVYQKDAGMQQITVKVYHQGELVLTTIDFKVAR